jgi:hypothetical protein
MKEKTDEECELEAEARMKTVTKLVEKYKDEFNRIYKNILTKLKKGKSL